MPSKMGLLLFLTIFTSSLVISQNVFAGKDDENKKGEILQGKQQEKPEEKKNVYTQNHHINIQTLNSPVRQNVAEFSLELPVGFLPEQAEYEIESIDKGKKIKLKEQKVTLVNKNEQNWLAKIPVDSLEPGNFKIEFEVKAAKSLMQTIKDYVKSAIKSAGKNTEENHDKDQDQPNRGRYKGETEFVISGRPVLPPDPGEAGMLTLEGIDSDNDGVRDDVQRWIIINHRDSEKTMEALAQAARASQVDLITAFVDKTKSIEATHQIFRASRCLDYLFGLDKQIELNKLMKSQILNTDARIRANIRANANFNGQTIELQDVQKTDCDFDPDTLPN